MASDITVYRFSPTKVVDYVRKKVDHMSSFPVIEMSRSITRNLAKDGLLDDGKEKLLAGLFQVVLKSTPFKTCLRI